LKARFKMGPAHIVARYQQYESKKHLGLRSKTQAHPGLIRFKVVSLGAEYRF